MVKPITNMNTVEKLQSSLDEMKADTAKFERGNNVAGTRVRTSAQKMKKMLQELRLEIGATRKSRAK